MSLSGTKIGLVLLITVCAVLAIAHGRLAAPLDSSAIVLQVSFWGSYEEWSMWSDIARGFEARHPGIRVKLNYIPGNYDDKVKLLLAADNAPDVMLIQDEPFPGYAMYGKFADLTDRAYGPHAPVNWDEDFWPTAAESFTHKGRVYGVPIWGGNVLVYYNRKMFREMGVEPPRDDWTFEEFVAKAKELTRDTDGDGRLDTFGFSLPGWVYNLPWTWGFGANYIDETRTQWAFTGPAAIAATRFYQDLRFTYRVAPTLRELPNTDENVMFMTNRVGMVVSGPWNSPPLRTAGIDFDVVHIPVGPAGERYTRVTWDALCMFDKCAHKDEAWQFMAYCISYEAQAIVGRYIRSVPALKRAKDAFLNPNNGWNEEKFIEALSYARLQPITIHWDRMNRILQPEYDLLLLNKQTPEETVRKIAEGMAKERVFPIPES